MIVFHILDYTPCLADFCPLRPRRKRGVFSYRYFCSLLSRIEDFVHETVFFRFFRVHIEVAVGVNLDFGKRLRRVLSKNIVDTLLVLRISFA